MTSIPGLTNKILRRPEIPDPFTPGMVWVVPQGEETHFARYRGRATVSQDRSASPEAVWVPKGGVLTLDKWKEAAPGWILMGFLREVVVSQSSVNDFWLKEFKFESRQIGEFDDYVKHLGVMLGMEADQVDDNRIKAWKGVFDAWGWEGVYADIHHRVLGTDTEHHKRGRSFWEFLKQVAAAPSEQVLRSLWPLMALHGEAEVYHAVLSFLDRAISWYSDGRAKVTPFYQGLLKQFCDRHDASRVFSLVSLLHSSNLPPSLRLVAALRVLDNARGDSPLPRLAEAPTDTGPSIADVEANQDEADEAQIVEEEPDEG